MKKGGYNILTFKIIFMLVVSYIFIEIALDYYDYIAKYRSEISRINKIFETIKEHKVKSISQELWEFKYKEIEDSIKEIRGYDYVEYAVVTAGGTIAAGEIRSFNINYFEKNVQLEKTNGDKKIILGELKVVFNAKLISERLKEELVRKMFSGSLKLLVLAILLFYVIEIIIMRKIWRAENYLSNIEINKLDKNFKIRGIKVYIKDEFDTIEFLINKLMNSLRYAFDKKEEVARNLTEAENKFMVFFDGIEESIFLADMNLGIVNVNRFAIKQTGYNKEEIEKMTLFQIFDVSDIKTIENEIITGMKERINIETTIVNKNKIEAKAEVSARIAEFGKDKFVIIVSKDISQKKYFESEMKKKITEIEILEKISGEISTSSQEWLTDTLKDMLKLTSAQSGHLFYYDKDENAFIQMVSADWKNHTSKEKSLKIMKEEIGDKWGKLSEGKTVVFDESDNSLIQRKIGNTSGHMMIVPVNRKSEVEALLLIESPDSRFNNVNTGDIKIMLNFIWKIIWQIKAYENIVKLNKIVNEQIEITQKSIEKQIEAESKMKEAQNEAVRANRLRSEFITNMSHEIRTPLNGIIGFTEMLRGMEKIKENKNIADLIYKSSFQLLRIINDILDYSKIETGFLNIVTYNFSIRKIVNEAAAEFALEAEENKTVINFFISDEIPEVITADAARIKQVLINITSNAVKYTKAGTVDIICENKLEEHKRLIVFSVKDTGIGISEDHQKKLFQPYDPGDYYMNKKYSGTGLGLAIAKRLVELMGGILKFETKDSMGTKFTFEIPYTIPVERSEVNDKRETIIVCDENRINRMVIAKNLENLGYDVILVEEPAQAEELILFGENCKILIADIYSGHNLPEKLKKSKIKGANEVITIGYSIIQNEKSDEIKKIYDGFTVKPYDLSEMSEIIKRAKRLRSVL